ncbi:DUF4870 domain-containing protein [Salinadaptatus halalkaliphilus]|nr:DUF4870 domain-containing protein [Salinadaptatus halalkaliphilus]
MSTDRDFQSGRRDESAAIDSRAPGPSVLAERTLLGVFAHVIAFVANLVPFLFVVPILIYRFSDHEFTRTNTRNAINWYAFLFATVVTFVAVFFPVAWLTDAVALPGVIELLLVLPVFLFAFFVTLLLPLTILFCLVATAKAIFGTAWTYPIAPDVVGYVASVRSQ